MLVLKRLIAFLASSMAILFAGTAFAATGQPHPWEVGLQAAATPVMEDVVWFHNFLLWVIAIIVVFVLALLVIIILKFNAKSNPVPSRTTHNTMIEVVWTVVPVLILVAIAVPSFRLLFYQLKVPAAEVTVKATGKQWFWTYTYPDAKIEFDSLMKQAKDLKGDEPRLLAVDNTMVVPVNKVVRVITTGADVIHSWAVPAFGIKMDAVPGRLNETWFNARKEGVYYGQCSQLCGKDHAFMPIAVRVVSKDAFDKWIAALKAGTVDDANKTLPPLQASDVQPAA